MTNAINKLNNQEKVDVPYSFLKKVTNPKFTKYQKIALLGLAKITKDPNTKIEFQKITELDTTIDAVIIRGIKWYEFFRACNLKVRLGVKGKGYDDKQIKKLKQALEELAKNHKEIFFKLKIEDKIKTKTKEQNTSFGAVLYKNIFYTEEKKDKKGNNKKLNFRLINIDAYLSFLHITKTGIGRIIFQYATTEKIYLSTILNNLLALGDEILTKKIIKNKKRVIEEIKQALANMGKAGIFQKEWIIEKKEKGELYINPEINIKN